MEAGNGAAIDSSSTISSARIAATKESLPHVRERSDIASPQKQRQSSLSAWLNKMRLRWSTRSQRPSRTMIPEGLSDREISHYETLIDLVSANPKRKQPRVVVITDLAKDYDDLTAMIVLKELHRLGVIKLLGFIANLMPAEKRTRFGRGALDSLGLESIPIAQGTSGFPRSAVKKHDELPYEFDCDFMATDERVKKEFDGNGEELLRKLCNDAVHSKKPLTLVLISSLEDIYTFSSKEPDLLKDAVSNIVLQGGYTISAEGKLEPDVAANNNRYDMEAATEFHTFIQDNHIKSTVYTKVAAFATPLTSDLFAEMARTNHPLGIHLKKAQVAQDLSFYQSAIHKDPEKRFAPFMDQEWFLKNKTAWFESNASENRELPDENAKLPDEDAKLPDEDAKLPDEDAELPDKKKPKFPDADKIIPWLTKVVVYDALAALGSSGTDALEALKVLAPGQTPPHSIHQIVGFAGPPSDPGVNPDQMASVLLALLKGSLLSCAPQASS